MIRSIIRMARRGFHARAGESAEEAAGAKAWAAFQARVAEERRQAVARHRPRRDIDARQREIVNAALAGGRR